MPSLSDGTSWDEHGLLQYADLLEQPIDSANPFHREKFQSGRFPAVDALVEFVRTHPGCSPIFAPEPPTEGGVGFDLTRIQIHLQLTYAANRFFGRFGEVPCDADKQRAIMAPFILGLFSDRVGITNIIPIALVRFDFDRLRLAPDIYVMRMNDALQRARWSAKPHSASAHDGVVSAATHAFVITGWNWPNATWIHMVHYLAAHNPKLRDIIEELFAALRLVTGVATGFAQELRVARGWTHFHADAPPEVFAAGARRYPEDFDNRGWLREDLPIISREEMRGVAEVLAQLRAVKDERLALALRRMNSAMIRADVPDAILDASIALEILLGDRDGDAIGYKLRLRAAVLANLETPGSGQAIFDAIKAIYDVRSRIVHGRGRSRTSAKEMSGEDARNLALDTLRQVLRILLRWPRYLDPLKIDSELLMGRAATA